MGGGNGFTFIPTIYEKHGFKRFLDKTYNEQKILYIKDKSSEIWGQRKLLPRHTSELYNKNILTKNDIVKQFREKNILGRETQSNEATPSYAGGEIIRKEKNMSDIKEERAFNEALDKHQDDLVNGFIYAVWYGSLPYKSV